MPENTEADKWTKLAAVAEATTEFVSNTYWLASFFDLISGMDEEILGLSYYAFTFGVVSAVFSTAGATYSHYLLNNQHQSSNNTNDSTNAQSKLTKPQIAALAGDFISHVGEIAGPITFVSNLASNNALPRWGKATIQAGAFLFGAFASTASVRTCKNSMKDSNIINKDKEKEKLVKTYLSTEINHC